MRHDEAARSKFSSSQNISPEWATVIQVHGSRVVEATQPGHLGEADAVWTSLPGLPLAVLTADCFGVVLHGEEAVGVAHAGWRGAAAGVVGVLRDTMAKSGHPAKGASVGPGIGPCCFEVGSEVAELFPGRVTTTSWGARSVDLAGVISDQLDGLEVWSSGRCTRHHEDLYSHRRDRTACRMAAVGWVP